MAVELVDDYLSLPAKKFEASKGSMTLSVALVRFCNNATS